MQKRGQLVTLVLDRNKLGDRGATAIARGLMLNYTLSTLGLSQNMVPQRSGRTRRSHPTAHRRRLCSSKPVGGGAVWLRWSLQISEDGAAAFAQCLIDNSTLVRSCSPRASQGVGAM